jgi:carbonic anhydrase
MEIHFVHAKDTQWLQDNGVTDPDPDHTHLVVGLPVMVNSGISDNPYLDAWNIYDFSPVANLDINPIISAYEDYFHYKGSLTTPDCNQIVNWIVMKNPLIISTNQFNVLNKWIKELYPFGRIYRKIQDLNGRSIYYINRSGRKNLY